MVRQAINSHLDRVREALISKTDQIICVTQKPQTALCSLSYMNKVRVLQRLSTNNRIHSTVLYLGCCSAGKDLIKSIFTHLHRPDPELKPRLDTRS